MTEAPAKPFRLLPSLTPLTAPFWTGGERGELVFQRCQDDGYRIHPPTPVCPRCYGRRIAPEAVSGRATVAAFTVNHQVWNPTMPPPYVVAIVEIDEQPDVRLTTNLVNVDPDAVTIGMPVRVVFEEHEDKDGKVWIPLFEPASGGSA
jgi:uncharacterized OB-fold protein